jgi:hypothetical protein
VSSTSWSLKSPGGLRVLVARESGCTQSPCVPKSRGVLRVLVSPRVGVYSYSPGGQRVLVSRKSGCTQSHCVPESRGVLIESWCPRESGCTHRVLVSPRVGVYSQSPGAHAESPGVLLESWCPESLGEF